MNNSKLSGISIGFFVSDDSEWQAVQTVYNHLETQGLNVFRTNDLSVVCDVGIYACHSNLFFDFDKGQWKHPKAKLSVGVLHDLYQDGGEEQAYFRNDSWHIYDIGFLPGPRWELIALKAALLGIPGPARGFRIVGWPKSDAVYKHEKRTTHADKPRVLVAASWQGYLQALDVLNFVDSNDFHVTFKFQKIDADSFIDSPWKDLLVAHSIESGQARTYLEEFSTISLAKEDDNIFELLYDSDIVISNGSNVGFEALLLGKPTIHVLDWPHPSGEFGEALGLNHRYFPGIFPTLASNLNVELTRVLNSETLVAEMKFARSQLVDESLIGNATHAFISALEDAMEQRAEHDPTSASLTFTRHNYPKSIKGEFQKNLVQKATIKSANFLERDALVVERDALVVERDALVVERDALVVERDALVVERDALVVERDALVVERDALVVERDAFSAQGSFKKLIEKLRSV